MYLDTSVVAKLFVREPESDYYAGLADGQMVSTSALAFTELWSALLMKERAGELDGVARTRAWLAFEARAVDGSIELVPLGQPVLRRANRILAACHPEVPLRSLDALHLASVDQVQDWPIATHDRRMRQAAELLGFPLAPLPPG